MAGNVPFIAHQPSPIKPGSAATMIELQPISEEHLPQLELWFEDPATRRWLGHPGWAEASLNLADPANGRHVLVARRQGALAGLLDVECDTKGDASFALVVDPQQRRQGIASSMIRAMFGYPEFRSVHRFWGGVESGNTSSERLLLQCGFTKSGHHSEVGFVDYEFCR